MISTTEIFLIMDSDTTDEFEINEKRQNVKSIFSMLGKENQTNWGLTGEAGGLQTPPWYHSGKPPQITHPCPSAYPCPNNVPPGGAETAVQITYPLFFFAF